ncbi:MAG: riboflavin synthase [Acidobacteriota bacterium]
MFTGLVETIGTLSEVKSMDGGCRLRVRTDLARACAPGDSLSVNGVCLTVTLAKDEEVHADVGPETVRITTLGLLQPGDEVNLERPLRFDGRLGGHLVQGHVDAVGVVAEVRQDADCHWLTVTFPDTLARLFVRKGSVAVDGVSLTVAGLGDGQFDVQVVPYTWTATTLSRRQPGHRVNLECDLVGKYVARAMELGGRGIG